MNLLWRGWGRVGGGSFQCIISLMFLLSLVFCFYWYSALTSTWDLLFSFGFQTCFMLNLVNCTIFYVKWPISNNFVTVIILESFHVSPIDDGHFRLLEGFFDGCSIPFSFFFFMANGETQCCIFDTTDVREKYMARFFLSQWYGQTKCWTLFCLFWR